MMVLISTIKKTAAGLFDRGLRETALRLFPYLSCVLFFEIYHQMLSVFFVYGKLIGVPLGIAAAFLLCALVVGSFFGNAVLRAALLLLYDVHLAVTAVMFVRAFSGEGSGVPAWIFVCRAVAAPWEAAAVLILTGSGTSKD